jgi:alkanesulfonate monooxygenase SsuD/methylene tetrahydromethanopterin reductase-like flavin-dependent oxidoreductase (luciferase family)
VTGSERRAIKVGLILPIFSGDPAKVLQAARDAERLGFDGVFAYDHFFPPGGPADRPSLEAFASLGAVAASTTRVALGTLVTRAVLRPAGLLAKMAATLDLISGGRMILGVGSGDAIDAAEHHSFGVRTLDIAERRVHLAETTAAIKALFRGDAYEGGGFVPALRGPLLPPPARPGGPPVWLGGRSDEVVRIAGSLADGWNGWGLDPDHFRAKAELLAEEAGRYGRQAEATWAGIALVGEDERETNAMARERRATGVGDPAWTGSAAEFAEHLGLLARAGATWAIVVLAGRPGRRDMIAERVLPELAALRPA